MAGRSNY